MNGKISLLVAFLVVASLLPMGWAQTTSAAERTLIKRYQDAKEDYTRHVDAYKNAREDFTIARERFRERRAGFNETLRLEKAKTFLLRAIEAMGSHLEIMKVRIESANSLSEDEKQKTLEEIDSYIAWFEDKKAVVEGVETKEDLLEAAGEIREKWSETRAIVKKTAGKILSSKLDGLIERAENASARIELKI